jgi:hypothetical protein
LASILVNKPASTLQAAVEFALASAGLIVPEFIRYVASEAVDGVLI